MFSELYDVFTDINLEPSRTYKKLKSTKTKLPNSEKNEVPNQMTKPKAQTHQTNG